MRLLLIGFRGPGNCRWMNGGKVDCPELKFEDRNGKYDNPSVTRRLCIVNFSSLGVLRIGRIGGTVGFFDESLESSLTSGKW